MCLTLFIKIENDKVIHYNEKVSKINKIYKEVLDTSEDTYNFEVEDCHTYYVTDSDVLVHNDCIGDLSDAIKSGLIKPSYIQLDYIGEMAINLS